MKEKVSLATGQEVTVNTARWSKVSLPDRLYYLEACRNNLRRIAPYWVEVEAAIRGHSADSKEGAESWFFGPYPVARTLRYLINGIKSGGRPGVPSRRLRIDGRSVSRVFPNGFHEGLLFYEVQAHVWSIGNQQQGGRYRKYRDGSPGCALVLGASHLSSVIATDTLTKMFCENRPVVCKIPTRFADLEPIYRELFHPLIRDRHLQLLCGGPELERALLTEPMFETVHLTGSVNRYERLLRENPFPKRSFTAQTGCVTPVVVVPGDWAPQQLDYQARHLVSMLVLNGGYSCATPQVLLLSKSWPCKETFLALLETELARVSLRDDRFPGSRTRREEFHREYPGARIFGKRSLLTLPWDQPTRLFQEESFCGMLAVVELESKSPPEFMTAAAHFCNQKLWGDLSCMILVDDTTRRRHERAVAHLVAMLEYGTVCLNVSSGLAFLSSVTPWGSYFDGRTETGNGWVNNPYFFDRPEKTVMEGSFMPLIPQPWVDPFPNLPRVGQAVFELELEPDLYQLMKFMKAFGASVWKRRRQSRFDHEKA